MPPSTALYLELSLIHDYAAAAHATVNDVLLIALTFLHGNNQTWPVSTSVWPVHNDTNLQLNASYPHTKHS